MAHDEKRWLSPRLQKAAALCNQAPAASESPLWLGIDLGTCDVVSMVVDRDGQPVAVCLDWADVVRDGIVWDFFGAVTLVRRHLATLEQQLGCRFTHAATSFPPGTDPRISINVLESAGLEISHVLDEPTAVADLLQLDNAGVVDIGGGTTGIAIVKQGRVTYSADEATGGHHISLTLAGNRGIGLEEAEQYKRSHAGEIWPVVKPVYEKMAEIVARHIAGQGIVDLWLAGGACMQPGVHELFRQRFPALPVHLPQHSLFVYRQSGDGGDSHDRRGAAESGGLRSGSGGAGEHAAGFLHGGDGVFQRRAGAMPCHGASAGGGAAYSARSGQRHAAANGDGV